MKTSIIISSLLLPLISSCTTRHHDASNKGTKERYISDVWVSDRGDGTYQNPVLYADYSDPDVCRVGDDFYMTASSFNCIPGLPILHSKDLVNWEIINYAVERLTPAEQFDQPSHGNGIWAPSIRYHKGEFYIFWGDPDNGIYMVKTADPRGRWSAPHLVHRSKGIIDTCPLWDEDGRAWIGHGYAGSRTGLKSILGLIEMTPDGRGTIGEDRVIYDGHEENVTIEGVKLYKRGRYYYILCPAGGVPTGYQLAMRSETIDGPYEWKVVMAQGNTTINGPHQGAWVDTPDGEEHWFLHFQDLEAYGRVMHLNPIHWIDQWPVIGINAKEYCGEPVANYRKPDLPEQEIQTPVESDLFESNRLGLQWQWHANANALWYFADAAHHRLRLFSAPITDNYANLWDVPNLLLQKFPAPAFTATAHVRFTPTEKYKGERAGLIIMGLDYAGLMLVNGDEGILLTQNSCSEAKKRTSERINATDTCHIASGDDVWLRVAVNKENSDAVCRFAVSHDGKSYAPLGEPFKAKPGQWIGAKVGLFITRNTNSNDGGWIDIDDFIIDSSKAD
ncbi:MAG: glycosyl hydrolase 43 family protein [Marinilabiliaceae bacterium]|nr:glycosyl hydrolase 43 family protein [Marinilabiliaceae bacterium]